ncbi:hypothetical protein ACDQ55_21585 [Chitinophaga sp. 30R24]|uniref:hypothetical protein n=1 Tax=Chitinophaga sp. 30R24 TaxID=3248838 RepID=UPI003B907DBF
MKLIGSRTEQEFREELMKSNQSLFSSDGDQRLLEVLKKLYPQMLTAYIIHWIPEQGEDLYKILINDDVIAKIELSHDNVVAPIVESILIPQYMFRLSRIKQIQLAVALDLARRDMAK